MIARTPAEVDKYVGAQLRDRRKKAGMSQDKLAKELGVSFQQVQKYERASNRVSAGVLFVCAMLLNCDPGDFFPSIEREPQTIAETMQSADSRQRKGRAPSMLRMTLERLRDGEPGKAVEFKMGSLNSKSSLYTMIRTVGNGDGSWARIIPTTKGYRVERV